MAPPKALPSALAPAVYRNFSIQPKKGDTFSGAPGVWAEWLRGPYFQAIEAGPLGRGCELASCGDGECRSTVRRPVEERRWGVTIPWAARMPAACIGTAFLSGASRLFRKSGRASGYFDDASKQVWVGDDPAGIPIELATMQDAFHGNAQNVTISSLAIEKYAGPQQHGAVNCQDGSGWTINGSTVRLNHARGISFTRCDAIKISNNRGYHERQPRA